MRRFLIVVILLSLYTCTRVGERTDNTGIVLDNNAYWIQDGRELPASDSLFYHDNPAPLFRKEFKIKNTVENATLYITAAGYYLASINGKNTGNNVLDPAWTDFSKRIYFSEYDVSSLIIDGDNCLGVSLGNGFYNPLPLRMWGHKNLRRNLPVGKPIFIAKLIINYKNGKSEEIVTDGTWKYAYGPIMKNSVYLGVKYDARKEIHGWNIPGFNDDSWSSAKKGATPGGKLQKTFFPPVQITKEITPVEISSPETEIYLVDMGINFTGTYKIKISGKKAIPSLSDSVKEFTPMGI